MAMKSLPRISRSFSTDSSPMATIIQSGMCKTNTNYRPTPTMFFFPGLTPKPIHNSSNFDWVNSVEANLDHVREEYVSLQEKGIQSDYVTKEGEHTLHRGDWEWRSFILRGKIEPKFAEMCPITTRILSEIPGLMTQLPFAYSFFSTLHPGSGDALKSKL